MGLSKSDRIHAVLIRHFEVARETRSRWLSKSKVGLPVWGRICRYVKNASPKTVPQCTLTTISTRSPAQPQSGEYSSYFFQVVHLGNCWWIFLEPQGLYLRAKRAGRYRGKGDKKKKNYQTDHCKLSPQVTSTSRLLSRRVPLSRTWLLKKSTLPQWLFATHFKAHSGYSKKTTHKLVLSTGRGP